jgi:FkbM family methyltransferase
MTTFGKAYVLYRKFLEFSYTAYFHKDYTLRKEKLKIFRTCLKLYRQTQGKNKDEQITVDFFDFKVTGMNAKSLLYLFEEIFLSRDYDFKTDNPAPLIIDCGANIGVSILYFKMIYPEAVIYGFEPNLVAYRLLQKNIAQNGLTGVTVQNACLSNVREKVKFYFSEHEYSSLTSSIHHGRGGDKSYEVEAIKLSDFMEGKTVDLVKMDVEGAEYEILNDLVETGTIRNAKQYIIEFHHNIPNIPHRFSTFLTKIEDCGFGFNIKGDFMKLGEFQDVLVYYYRRG